MSDTLPVPIGAGPPANDTLMAALAMAAARLAIEQSREPVAVPLTREEVETIARKAVFDAFREFGVDLASVESIEAHRAVIAHARRSAALWTKAGQAALTGIVSAAALAVYGLVTKFGLGGGAK